MCFGLGEQDIELITKTISEFKDIEKAVLFGSRAKGNHKKGSDVDLAIKGKKLLDTTIRRLNIKLNEELPLPYFFDVVNFDEISNAELVDHINRVGKTIFSR